MHIVPSSSSGTLAPSSGHLYKATLKKGPEDNHFGKETSLKAKTIKSDMGIFLNISNIRLPTFPVTDQRLHAGMKLPQLIVQILKMLLLLLKPLTNTNQEFSRLINSFLSPLPTRI